MKTVSGRARIAAANERLDQTVAEMGERHRTDVTQGENADGLVQHQTPPEFETPIEFTPLDRDESRVVLPPAEEAGEAETRDICRH